MPAIHEMREVCQTKRMDRRGKMVFTGFWVNRLITRRFSIYFTWFFVKLGVSANQVTALMLFFGIAGIALCIPHVLWTTILGGLFLILLQTLDCVDGEVARWTKTSSVKGVYLDLISHLFCNTLAKPMVAFHLYLWQGDRIYLYAVRVDCS